MTTTNRKFALLAAAGSTLGIAAAANGQTVINVAGATLFENFFKAPASTNDFFDADGDGFCKNCPAPNDVNDQLAKFTLPPVGGTDQLTQTHWCVQDFGSGSVTGLQVLVSYGFPNAYVTDGETGLLNINALSRAFHNRSQYFGSGAGATGIRNSANPYGAPVRSTTDGLYTATYNVPGSASAGGTRIDIAPLDVPTFWGARNSSGSGDFAKTPGQPGYGNNTAFPSNKDGTATTTDQRMVDLGVRQIFNPANPPLATDQNTIFDTQIAGVPIAVLTNLGTGLQTIKQSDLRQLNATGRLLSGENLVMITREAGSGTRNGFCNSIGLDPSFGVGENVGINNGTTVSFANLGAGFLPSNKIGSGDMENTIINVRLGLGYTGAERYVNNGLTTKVDLLGVAPDLISGNAAVAARPTANNIAHNNGTNGYVIFGVEQFATIGDPLAVSAAHGGDAGHSALPPMDNVEAAAYINNITKSIAAFQANPNLDSTTQTPGEYIGVNFAAIAALDFQHDINTPLNLVANPSFVAAVQSTFLSSGADGSVYAKPANAPFYTTFGNGGLNGKVPTRTTGVVYSDNVANGTNYINQATPTPGTVSYTSTLTNRNRIAGDFSGDAARNLNDISDMISAWRQRNGGPAWTAPAGTGPIAGAPGTDAVIEILGDFNGDGNFNTQDVRYFADGLAIDPVTSKLDRKKGFTQVDTSFGGNFFGTTKATPAAYAAGDSRADVNGIFGLHTPGFQPIGQDGAINGLDIDYVNKQFKQNARVTDGALNWNNTSESINGDLSADMTGDLVVDRNDTCEIVRSILGTRFGDVNLDGSVNCADLAIINQGGLPYAGGWAQGDVNGDGQVTIADVKIIRSNILPGDINGDGTVNTADLTTLLGSFGQSVPCDDLLNLTGSGTVNTATLTTLLANFGQSSNCP